MSTQEIAAGAAEPIIHEHDIDGALVPGSTLRWWVRRASDGLVMNASNTFVTGASAGVGRYFTLPELVALPGIYVSSFNTGAITNATPSDQYLVTIEEVSPTPRVLATGEIRTSLVPAVQSGLATSSALATAQAALTTLAAAVAGIPALVWAVTDGTMTKGAALDLLRRRTTNARRLVNGVLTLFTDLGAPEKTSNVLDVNGDPVVPQAGEASQASAEA